MSITIHFSPDEETEFREQAERRGLEVGEYVKLLARDGRTRAGKQQNNPNGTVSPDGRDYGPAAGNVDPTGRVYDPAAAIALLEELMQGDEDEQRETMAFLRKALDEDRPGQRSIFGKGVNPYPADYVPSDEAPKWLKSYGEDDAQAEA